MWRGPTIILVSNQTCITIGIKHLDKWGERDIWIFVDGMGARGGYCLHKHEFSTRVLVIGIYSHVFNLALPSMRFVIPFHPQKVPSPITNILAGCIKSEMCMHVFKNPTYSHLFTMLCCIILIDFFGVLKSKEGSQGKKDKRYIQDWSTWGIVVIIWAFNLHNSWGKR